MTGPGDGPLIHRWSTDDVEPLHRLAYYAATTSSALVPLTVTCSAPRLDASVESAAMGPLDVLRMKGSAHEVSRGSRDIARSGTHQYYLMLNVASTWAVVHAGNHLLSPGDLVFIDSNQPYSLRLETYEIVTLGMPAQWVQQWVRRPDLLAGRCLSQGSMAGRALARMLPALSPAFAVESPLPGPMIADQIGALLSAAEADLSGRAAMVPPPDALASGRSVETRRAQAAARMLGSRMFSEVPPADIARRAGFAGVAEMLAALQALGLKIDQP